MIIHLTNNKSFEVFLIQKSWFPSHQDESIAMRYLNAFTIEENNQFEIMQFIEQMAFISLKMKFPQTFND